MPSCLDGTGTKEFRVDNFEGTTIKYYNRQDFTATDIKELNLKHIPGFKLLWCYENIEELRNHSTQTYSDKNEEFRRIAFNAQYLGLNRNESELQRVWAVVKEIRAQWVETMKVP